MNILFNLQTYLFTDELFDLGGESGLLPHEGSLFSTGIPGWFILSNRFYHSSVYLDVRLFGFLSHHHGWMFNHFLFHLFQCFQTDKFKWFWFSEEEDKEDFIVKLNLELLHYFLESEDIQLILLAFHFQFLKKHEFGVWTTMFGEFNLKVIKHMIRVLFIRGAESLDLSEESSIILLINLCLWRTRIYFLLELFILLYLIEYIFRYHISIILSIILQFKGMAKLYPPWYLIITGHIL